MHSRSIPSSYKEEIRNKRFQISFATDNLRGKFKNDIIFLPEKQITFRFQPANASMMQMPVDWFCYIPTAADPAFPSQ